MKAEWDESYVYLNTNHEGEGARGKKAKGRRGERAN